MVPTLVLALIGCVASPSDSVEAPPGATAQRDQSPARDGGGVANPQAFTPFRGGFSASAPALGATFGVDGARLFAGRGQLRVATSAIRGQTARPTAPNVAPCATSATCRDRLEYGFAQATEWWVAQPFGLEQGWTVTAPGVSPLTVDVTVSGGDVNGDGSRLTLTSAVAEPIVVSGLSAFDATGRQLAASFVVTNAGFQVRVDDRGAKFPVTIDPVYTTATTTLDGEADGDGFASAVSAAGDVNGDGFDDILVGAPDHDGGRAYVFLGSATGPLAPAAAVLSGTGEERFGAIVAGGCDFNGDGFDDVAIGAPLNAEASEIGHVYVYEGSAAGLATTAARALAGETAGDQFGAALACAGDVQDDGRDDLVVGASAADEFAGKAYLYSGSSSGLGEEPIYTVTGSAAGARVGAAVGGAGDTNRDGFGDVAYAAPGLGTIYVYGGGSFGLSEVRLNVVTSTTAGFGTTLSHADVNGDRYDDLLVGNEGSAQVFHGSVIGPSTAADHTWSGAGVLRPVGVGDLDHDGYDEVAVGSASDGAVAVYAGSSSGAGSTSIADFSADSVADGLGDAIAGVGDVNGDGAPDVLLGTPTYADSTGRAWYYRGYDATDADADGFNATDDCDDTNATIFPGAVEVCDDANADEDCNGLADDAAAAGQTTFYADADRDNFGDAGAAVTACDAPPDHVTDATDCDDTRYAVHPGATEICNALDDNCDGSTDGADAAEPLVWYEDADGDTYPNPEVSTESCQQPDGYVKLGEDDDCDDQDAGAHPYADEIAGDGIDQDCDGADPAAEKKCGCANGGQAPGWLIALLGAAGLVRRRGGVSRG
jgi:hypothetical protein